MDDKENSGINPEPQLENERAVARLPDEPEPEAPEDAAGVALDSEDDEAAKSESDEDDETALADADEDDADGDEEAKPKSRKRRRRASGNERRLQAETKALQARIARLEASTQAANQPATQSEPKQEDFTDYAEYVAARAEWKVAQNQQRRDSEVARTHAQRAFQSSVETFEVRCDEARDRIADFDDAIKGINDIELSPAMTHILVESENGPDMAYHLAKNPQKTRQIARMNPVQAAVELGRISAVVTPASKPKPRSPSRATKIVQGSGGTPALNLDKLSYDEYVSERRKQAS